MRWITSKLLFLCLLGVAAVNCFSQQIPRPEYPQPQFERELWLNLNGEWEFEFDRQGTPDSPGSGSQASRNSRARFSCRSARRAR